MLFFTLDPSPSYIHIIVIEVNAYIYMYKHNLWLVEVWCGGESGEKFPQDIYLEGQRYCFSLPF